MNEAASDSESSDSETCPKLSQGIVRQKSSHTSKSLLEKQSATLFANDSNGIPNESNFFTQQVRLQIEARMALSQAKDMAHMQMEVGLNFERKSSF